jgi:hypothetical protein
MPVIIRSSLKPYWRKERQKWQPRGTYPTKNEAGQVEPKRGFLGVGRDTKTLCQQACNRLNAEMAGATRHSEPRYSYPRRRLGRGAGRSDQLMPSKSL